MLSWASKELWIPTADIQSILTYTLILFIYIGV